MADTLYKKQKNKELLFEMSDKIIVNTDGGARGNPGPAAMGVVIGGKEYEEYLGIKTNNQAEYLAVIFALQKIKQRIETVATRMGIQGYARIDAFVQIDSGDLHVIEVNNLPGLTPATVLYHQGLSENPPLFPRQLLEQLVSNKGY